MVKRVIEEKSWRVLVLQPNMNFGIEFDAGWFFARSRTVEIVPYRYDRWNYLEAGGSADFAVIRNAANRSFMWVDDKTEIWQIFSEWNQPRLRVHSRIPRPEPRRGLRGEIGMPTITSTFGWWLEGYESPIGRGTGRGMFFLPYETDLEFGLYNPETYGVQPLTDFYMNKIVYTKFDPETDIGLHMIKGILTNRIPTLTWQAGIKPFTFKKFYEVFGIKPVVWDGLEARVNGELIYSVTGGE